MDRLAQWEELKDGEYRDFVKWLPISNTYNIPAAVINRQWALDYLLLYAVCYKNRELIQALLDRGADPNFTRGFSVFQHVIEEDNCPIFELILKHRRNIAIEEWNYKMAAMSVEMMTILKIIRPEVFEQQIHIFVSDVLSNKKIEKLKWLLENGGKEQLTNWSVFIIIFKTLSCTNFQWLCNEQLQRESSFTILTMLVEAGLPINFTDGYKESALDTVITVYKKYHYGFMNNGTYYSILYRDKSFCEKVIDYLIDIGGKLNKVQDEEIQRRIDAVRRTKQCMFLLAYDQRHQR